MISKYILVFYIYLMAWKVVCNHGFYDILLSSCLKHHVMKPVVVDKLPCN